jgi:rod shape-determining protein MreC
MPWRLRIIALAFLVVIILVTVSVNSDPNREPTVFERALLEIVGTFQEGVSLSTRGLENVWREYFYLVGLHEENRRLKKALEHARGEVTLLRETERTNRRLQKLMNFSKDYDLPVVGARVVAWDPGPWFKTLTIDRGTANGLVTGLPVVNEQGVVGRVVEVSPRFAKVLLITDYNSRIDALVSRNRERGIVAGRGEKTLGILYVRKNIELMRGDMVVTSGMGGMFPKGIPLGRISRIKRTGHDIFLEIDMTPAVDFDHLEELLVIQTIQPLF